MKKGISLMSGEVYLTLDMKYDHLSARDKKFTQVQPGRIVTDFEFFDPETDKKIKVNFRPPYELRVKFNHKDLERVGGKVADLELKIFDGTKWIEFENQFELITEGKKEKKGYGVVMVKRWDPAVGWFP